MQSVLKQSNNYPYVLQESLDYTQSFLYNEEEEQEEEDEGNDDNDDNDDNEKPRHYTMNELYIPCINNNSCEIFIDYFNYMINEDKSNKNHDIQKTTKGQRKSPQTFPKSKKPIKYVQSFYNGGLSRSNTWSYSIYY